jgi:Yip1 domain
MALDFQALLIAARDTVQQPRQGARWILQMGLPAVVGWLGLSLMAVVSAGLSTVVFILSGPTDDPSLDPAMVQVFSNPIQLAIVQILLLVIGVMMISGIGRMFGGKGQFADALLLVVWLEFIMLLLQIAQLVALLTLPPLAAMMGLFGLVLFLWLLTNFIAELHGFPSVLATFFGIIGALLVVTFAAAVLVAMFLGIGG